MWKVLPPAVLSPPHWLISYNLFSMVPQPPSREESCRPLCDLHRIHGISTRVGMLIPGKTRECRTGGVTPRRWSHERLVASRASWIYADIFMPNNISMARIGKQSYSSIRKVLTIICNGDSVTFGIVIEQLGAEGLSRHHPNTASDMQLGGRSMSTMQAKSLRSDHASPSLPARPTVESESAKHSRRSHA